MENETQTTSIASETQSLLRTKVEGHDTLIKYLLIGIVGSIILLAFDVYQDRTIDNRLTIFATEAADSRMRISEAEYKYNEEVKNLKSDLSLFKQCLKLGGWSECF